MLLAPSEFNDWTRVYHVPFLLRLLYLGAPASRLMARLLVEWGNSDVTGTHVAPWSPC
jgi:hypothetical protein